MYQRNKLTSLYAYYVYFIQYSIWEESKQSSTAAELSFVYISYKNCNQINFCTARVSYIVNFKTIEFVLNFPFLWDWSALFVNNVLEVSFFIQWFKIFSEKELSFCHKLRFSNTYIFLTQCRWPLIFEAMSPVRSNWKKLWSCQATLVA